MGSVTSLQTLIEIIRNYSNTNHILLRMEVLYPQNIKKRKDKIELEMQRAADAVGLFNGPIKGDIVLDKKKFM